MVSSSGMLSLVPVRKRKNRMTVAVVMGVFCLIVTVCGVNSRYEQTNGAPQGTYIFAVIAITVSITHTQTVQVQ